MDVFGSPDMRDPAEQKETHKRRRWYVGIDGRNRVAFYSTQTPTPKNTPYAAVVGPFRTKRAAIWVENNGYNGWYRDVNNAERLSKGK